MNILHNYIYAQFPFCAGRLMETVRGAVSIEALKDSSSLLYTSGECGFHQNKVRLIFYKCSMSGLYSE